MVSAEEISGSTTCDTYHLLGTDISSVNMESAIEMVRQWIDRGERGRTVSFVNVHMIVEGLKKPWFQTLVRNTDLRCPDGMPIVWIGRQRSKGGVGRVCGPEFMPAFCRATEDLALRHFFYGGAPGVAETVSKRLQALAPGLEIAGVYSPPFAPLSEEGSDEVVAMINGTRPDIVWVCLGCPKQEIWMHEYRHKLTATALMSVGFAFDVLAGTKKRAPKFFREHGMECVFRLAQDPRRLWHRYLVYNSIFLFRYVLECMRLPVEPVVIETGNVDV